MNFCQVGTLFPDTKTKRTCFYDFPEIVIYNTVNRIFSKS